MIDFTSLDNLKDKSKEVVVKEIDPIKQMFADYQENIKKSAYLRTEALKNVNDIDNKELALILAKCISAMIGDQDVFYKQIEKALINY